MASGEEAGWRRVSVKANRSSCPPADAPKGAVKPEIAKMYLEARILEVRVFQDKTAAVLAEWVSEGHAPIVDLRQFRLEDGRWLNNGEAHAATLAGARAQAAIGFAMGLPKPTRPATQPAASKPGAGTESTQPQK
jgi:hypothetical protein